jgi:ABC-type bacteriocin/lantibiotic exporter with double-glycine peptidase domain
MDEFRRSFTGVALMFEPPTTSSRARRSRMVWRYVGQILGQSGSGAHPGHLDHGAALRPGVPLLTGALVDRVVPRGDQHLSHPSSPACSACRLQFLASLIRAHLLLHLRTYLDARMTLGFLDHMTDLPYDFFQRRSAGDLMMRLNSNATIREILTSGALSGLLDGALAILYLASSSRASAQDRLLVARAGGAAGLTFVLTRRKQHDLNTQSLSAQAKSQGYQVEMLGGMETLKSVGSEQRAGRALASLFVDTLNVSLDRGRLAANIEALRRHAAARLADDHPGLRRDAGARRQTQPRHHARLERGRRRLPRPLGNLVAPRRSSSSWAATSSASTT